MPVDTANKRYSLLGLGLDSLRLRPIPDGAFTFGDREHLLPLYRGFVDATDDTPTNIENVYHDLAGQEFIYYDGHAAEAVTAVISASDTTYFDQHAAEGTTQHIPSTDTTYPFLTD